VSGNALAAGCAAFSCGVILLYRLPVLPVWNWLIAGILCLLLVAVAGRSGLFRRGSLLLALVLAGLIWSAWHAQARLVQRLPADLEGVPLTVQGYVCDLPAAASFSGLRFSFCVTGWPEAYRVESLPETLRLTWYQSDVRIIRQQRLELEVVLKRPHGNLNPAGFRYEDWLFRHGYRATGSVRSARPAEVVPCDWRCRYTAARLWLADRVEEKLGEAGHYPLIASLMIGNRQAMTAEYWALLKATGTVHLVAISGLHLGLVALASGVLSRRLLLMLPARWLPERRLRQLVFVLTLACCFGYALIAGFTVPTRRALIMVTLAAWTLLRARQSSSWHVFLLALAWVLVSDPFAPLDQGFWLSFGAVAVLLLIFAGRLRQPGWLAGLVLAQLGVFAGLWPILVSFGQEQPLAALVANLFAIPWLSLVVMPALALGGLLMVLPGMDGFVVTGLDAALAVLWRGLELVSSWSWPQLTATAGPALLAAVVMLSALWVSAAGLSLAVAASLLLWFLLPASPAKTAQETAVTVLDVGQGLSVLVRDQGRVLVYDTGPAVEGVYSAVESVLVPVLSSWGVRRIDHLVVSHADRDHAGNLPGLLGRFPVDRIESGEAEVIRDRLSGYSVAVEACRSRREQFGSLELMFWRSRYSRTGNDASCVLVLRHRDSGVEWILPGDISVAGEREFLRDYHWAWPQPPSFRIVLAPHHGSLTSSSEHWVSSLSPDMVVYSAGYRHRFGHPHPSVTARYRTAGSRALNTACSGSITFLPSATGVVVRESRHESPFWIGGPGLARAHCDEP